LVADCHSILGRCRNHFSQLVNVHGFNDDIQTEIHTAKPLVPEPSVFEVELAIEKFQCHKSSGIDQMPSELIKTWGRIICYEIHECIISVWNKEQLPEKWKSCSLYLSIRRAVKQTAVNIAAYHFCLLYTKFCPTSCCQG
jgi:hypothetical protein